MTVILYFLFLFFEHPETLFSLVLQEGNYQDPQYSKFFIFRLVRIYYLNFFGKIFLFVIEQTNFPDFCCQDYLRIF